VLQNGDGVVDLKIQDTQTKKTTCSGSNGSTRLLGLLQGNGSGRFRTYRDRASASVVGTDWEVQNRCDGTLIIVRRGTVEVTDFRLHKTVTLHQRTDVPGEGLVTAVTGSLEPTPWNWGPMHPRHPTCNSLTASRAGVSKNRRRPTLPGPCEPSTIGAEGLNCSVRNGKRCFPLAMATGNW
jgi:hypothetical protein